MNEKLKELLLRAVEDVISNNLSKATYEHISGLTVNAYQAGTIIRVDIKGVK